METLRRLLHGLIGNGDDEEYQCRGCGAGFDTRRQVCPACESYRIERREW